MITKRQLFSFILTMTIAICFGIPAQMTYAKEVFAEDQLIITEHVEQTAPRYGFTEEEVYLLSQLLCGDAKKDGDGEYDFISHGTDVKIGYFEEMAKVLCVVMNRQRSTEKYFPDTVREVVLQKGQFSPMKKNLKSKPSQAAIDKVNEWCEMYDNYDPGAQVIPESHLYFKAGKNNTNITRERY